MWRSHTQASNTLLWVRIATLAPSHVEQFNRIPADIANDLYIDERSPSLLRWRISRGNQIKAGAVAGTRRPDGRWRVSFKKQLFYTYRIYMFLTTGKDIAGLLVDHKDNNSSHHAKDNLRIATRAQNNANRKPRFKYKGVSLHKKTGLWRARITIGGQELTSYHATDIEAARAYDRVAFKTYGEFAYLNFPEDTNVHSS